MRLDQFVNRLAVFHHKHGSAGLIDSRWPALDGECVSTGAGERASAVDRRRGSARGADTSEARVTPGHGEARGVREGERASGARHVILTGRGLSASHGH